MVLELLLKGYFKSPGLANFKDGFRFKKGPKVRKINKAYGAQVSRAVL